MIKGLLVYINIIFLSLLGYFAEDAVTVDAQMPATAKPGETFEVVVNIKKGSITEFAKFQMQLPVGFTAENIDSKSGSFTFAQQQVKIIWMALPTEAQFQIKFKVKSFPSTNGTYNLTGKFHYVLQGTKYEASTPVKIITVGTPSDVAMTPTNTGNTANNTGTAANTGTATNSAGTGAAKNNTQNTTGTTQNTATNNNASTQTNTATNNATSNTATNQNDAVASADGIEVKRILSGTQIKKGSSIMVDLVINKGSTTGFAKIMETLPPGFTAEEVDAFGGVFSFQEGKVKILWMTMPASKEIRVKYKITYVGDAKGKFPVEGFFSYLKESDGTNKKIAFNNSEITVVDQITEEPVAIVDTKKDEPKKDEPKKDEPKKDEPKKDEPKKDPIAQTPKKEPKKDDKTPSVKVIKDNNTADNTKKSPSSGSAGSGDFGSSNPNQGLYYSVQICATKRQVDVAYFKQNNNINEKVYTMMHEGWHKYVVGEFTVYKDARDHREVVKTENKVVGPFVTAYNKGTRITVQEALMISGQKWVQ
ncbi:MAG: hypothetical protein ACKOXB_15315 [Flavobacteriales bacterium]